jgi:lysophospholipase L1-like esterase
MFGDPVSGAAEAARDSRQTAAEEIADHERRGRWRKGLAASILTVASLTLVLELALRVTGDRQDAFLAGVQGARPRWLALLGAGIFEEVTDDVRRYAGRPGATCTVDDLTFRVSNHRTRGPDFPLEKPANERRLLVLGDSFSFGMWCPEDETLAGQLVRRANDAEAARGSGITWRALNLGVPGYHSGQQLRALEQSGLALEPDVVVLYYNTNDIAREGFFLDAELGVLRSDHLPLPTWLRRPLWGSHLYGFIARKYERSFAGIPEPHVDDRVPWAHTRDDNQRATRAALTRIAEVCAENELPLFFVNQPLMTWSGDARRADWNVLPLVQWAEDVRAELGVPGVSLLGWLRGYADGVDRLADGAPQDFLPDILFADEAVQAVVTAARERCETAGGDWDTLALPARVALLEQAAAGLGGLPEEPDFHLTGEGYGRIADVCYPRLRDAGLLP